ncbi:MAG: SAM-dependent methyltransferase [Hyphomonas sp.]|uniref:SAM-dependent methyltransferase n=1 Tax=Hyphomonas sp. TaxID=87 RepID=UPI00329A6079
MAQAISSTSISLDKFYTRLETADACMALFVARLPEFNADLFVEPSAGDGVFLERLPEPRFGIDIAPAASGIETGDFLAWVPNEDVETIAVVGNPPFGRNGSKAIAWFNHSARFADVIAFIMPASLMKRSMQDRLDDRFHLVDEMPLLAEPFRAEFALHQVNTVFQIWKRGIDRRPKSIRKTVHSDFRFLASSRGADFVVRRVGARAGDILPPIVGSADTRGYSPSSNLFVKAQGVDPQLLEARFRTLDFTEVRGCVAANPSVSKSDVVALYGSLLDLERLSRAAKPHDASVEMTPLTAFRGECLS